MTIEYALAGDVQAVDEVDEREDPRLAPKALHLSIHEDAV
jgi:hypothetical protein